MTLKPESYTPIIKQLFGALIIATVTWALTTAQASAVQQQKMVAMEKAIESKASKETVEQFQREVLSRLERIERKLDRAR